MYIQRFVKGISGEVLDRHEAQSLLTGGAGIRSNWWLNQPDKTIKLPEIAIVLTDANLDRHVHDYDHFGNDTPFISVAAGCVERDILLLKNHVYAAVDTALEFATRSGDHPGALFYGWIVVSQNPAVPISSVAEAIRDLNVYHRWSPFQLEGEVTAKINIPANQIEYMEWWDGSAGVTFLDHRFDNPGYVDPAPITNVRGLF